MKRTLTPSGLLTYPGRRAGVDPGHIALRNGGKIRFSAVSAMNAQFINLLSGARGNTVTAAPPFKLDGNIGPSVNFNTVNAAITFTGQETKTDASFTVAAIVRFPASPGGAFQVIFNDTNGTAPCYDMFLDQTTGRVNIQGGATAVDSGITTPGGAPCFVAASSSSTVSHFIIQRLDTGKTLTARVASGDPGLAASGSWMVGGNTLFTQQFSGQVAAVALISDCLSVPDMLAWAKDPWSFWYPAQASRVAFDPALVKAAAAAAASPVTYSRRYNWLRR